MALAQADHLLAVAGRFFPDARSYVMKDFAGKTAVITELRRLLPEWEVFETDILWDSGGDWQFVRSNWLRIAHSIAALASGWASRAAMSVSGAL